MAMNDPRNSGGAMGFCHVAWESGYISCELADPNDAFWIFCIYLGFHFPRGITLPYKNLPKTLTTYICFHQIFFHIHLNILKFKYKFITLLLGIMRRPFHKSSIFFSLNHIFFLAIIYWYQSNNQAPNNGEWD